MEKKIGRSESEASLATLLERARQHDATAMKVLIAACQPKVKRWAQQRMRTGWIGVESASDITQEVMLRVHDSLPTFDGSNQAGWNQWLRIILANTIVDAARHAT